MAEPTTSSKPTKRTTPCDADDEHKCKRQTPSDDLSLFVYMRTSNYAVIRLGNLPSSELKRAFHQLLTQDELLCDEAVERFLGYAVRMDRSRIPPCHEIVGDALLNKLVEFYDHIPGAEEKKKTVAELTDDVLALDLFMEIQEHLLAEKKVCAIATATIMYPPISSIIGAVPSDIEIIRCFLYDSEFSHRDVASYQLNYPDTLPRAKASDIPNTSVLVLYPFTDNAQEDTYDGCGGFRVAAPNCIIEGCEQGFIEMCDGIHYDFDARKCLFLTGMSEDLYIDEIIEEKCTDNPTAVEDIDHSKPLLDRLWNIHCIEKTIGNYEVFDDDGAIIDSMVVPRVCRILTRMSDEK